MARMDKKKETYSTAASWRAINGGRKEIDQLKEVFNQKCQLFLRNGFGQSGHTLFSKHVKNGAISIENNSLECHIILPDEMYERIVTTQQIQVVFTLNKT